MLCRRHDGGRSDLFHGFALRIGHTRVRRYRGDCRGLRYTVLSRSGIFGVFAYRAVFALGQSGAYRSCSVHFYLWLLFFETDTGKANVQL